MFCWQNHFKTDGPLLHRPFHDGPHWRLRRYSQIKLEGKCQLWILTMFIAKNLHTKKTHLYPFTFFGTQFKKKYTVKVCSGSSASPHWCMLAAELMFLEDIKSTWSLSSEINSIFKLPINSFISLIIYTLIIILFNWFISYFKDKFRNSTFKPYLN